MDAPYGAIFEVDAKKMVLNRVNDPTISDFDFEMSGEAQAEAGDQIDTATDTDTAALLGVDSNNNSKGNDATGSESAVTVKEKDTKNIKDNKGDNRLINDTNTAQKLTLDQIEEFKESGVSGKEIIQSL